MKGKENVIGFICVMLSCILVIGITFGLLRSASKFTVGATADGIGANSYPSALNPELEVGYKDTFIGRTTPDSHLPLCNIAYKSDKKTLDVNNVKLTLSYGVMCSHVIDEEFIEYQRVYLGWDITEFEIYFADNYENKNYNIRKVHEGIISEKYRVEYVADWDKNLGYYNFNHSEEITMPKELFTESEGIIKICIGGMNVAGNEPKYAVLCSEEIKYQLIGNDKVVLSPGFEY